MDWSSCPDIERVPGWVSGEPVVVGTVILATCLTDNMGDASAEDIDELFPGLGVERARRIINHARRHAHQPHPV